MPIEPTRASSVAPRGNVRDDSLAQRAGARDSCRVLVVDDDALVRARLGALLNACHYDVEVATSGEDALGVLDATHCNIVLTDWQMPDMDGLALCRRIRLRPHEGYIYVLMLTVRDSAHDVRTGLAAGADAYMIKGGTIDDIISRLEIGRRITRENSSWFIENPGDRGVSYTDTTSGAHSIGYLTKHLPRELARSQRRGHPLAILQCYIEGFELFSDRFGLEASTDLLRAFAAGATGCLRREDWVVRANGPAFIVVLPETTAKGAQCAARRLQQEFALHPSYTAAEHTSFTVRIGVTAVDAKHDAQSMAQVESVLSAASRGKYANRQLCTEQADESALSFAIESTCGEKRGLN